MCYSSSCTSSALYFRFQAKDKGATTLLTLRQRQRQSQREKREKCFLALRRKGRCVVGDKRRCMEIQVDLKIYILYVVVLVVVVVLLGHSLYC